MASGPERISAQLVKTFAEELTPAWSLPGVIPSIWEKATIIPVAKKPCPKQNNDFGPVTLASVVIKTFEQIMIGFLRKEVNDLLNSC